MNDATLNEPTTEPLSRITAKLIQILVLPTNTNFTLKTELYRDLLLWGDDALEFFDWFASEFSVDLSNLEFKKYFPCEGKGFFTLISNWVRGKSDPDNYQMITLRQLESAVRSGVWAAKHV